MGMAEKIKERRNIMGLTQEELGQKLGLQKSAIAKYENGRVENIKRSVISNMAKILECSPCYLLDWEESKKESNKDTKIMAYYNELNEIGKEIATEQVRLLTLDEKYTKPDNIVPITEAPLPDHLAVQAAHNDSEIDDEELGKMQRDIEWLKKNRK